MYAVNMPQLGSFCSFLINTVLIFWSKTSWTKTSITEDFYNIADYNLSVLSIFKCRDISQYTKGEKLLNAVIFPSIQRERNALAVGCYPTET